MATQGIDYSFSRPRRWTGWPLLALLVLAPLPLFWFGLERIVSEWVRPEYRFKAYVPIFSLLMFLQVGGTMRAGRTPGAGRWLGLAIVGLSLVLALVGNLEEVDDLVWFGMIGYLVGLLIAVHGVPAALQFWAPVASLFLMLPLPRLIYNAIHGFFESLASAAGLAALQAVGVPAKGEGLLVHFGPGSARIADITSGLVNLLPLLLVFFFVATLVRASLVSRLLPLLLAAPLLVLLSAAQLFGYGLLIDKVGAGAAETFLRWTNDWTVLAIATALLAAISLGVEARLAASRTAGIPLRRRIAVDVGALKEQGRRLGQLRATPVLAAAACLALVGSGIHALDARPSVHVERPSYALFPPEIGGWSGSRMAIGDAVANTLAADDYVLIDYVHRDHTAFVNFWIAFYDEQRASRGAIHSPEVCLTIDGWNIVTFERTSVAYGSGGQMIPINRAVIERDGVTSLVYYWFEGRGRQQANELLARFATKLDSLVTGRSDGALVRLATVILDSEEEAAADLRLQAFLDDVHGHIPRFVPR